MIKKFKTPYLLEERHEFVDSLGQRLSYVHSREECFNPKACVIHHPSGHHMKSWPLVWRPDRRLFERICRHGIGHPDPDDVMFQSEVLVRDGVSIHGCDGCCHINPTEEG